MVKNACYKRMLSSVSDVSEVCCKCFRWILQKEIGMLHMLQWLYMYVANVCSQCFIFQMYVASMLMLCYTHML
jgi:hypothetical protein